MEDSSYRLVPSELIRQIADINQDRNGAVYDSGTNGRAPHKPFLLLAVLDLVEAGIIQENLIPFDERLLAAFDLYWSAACGDRPTNVLQPFWYLRSSPFWRHLPRHGRKPALAAIGRGKVPSRTALADLSTGVRLSDDLYRAANDPAQRQELRRFIISHFFREPLATTLASSHQIFIDSHHYEGVLRLRVREAMTDLFLDQDGLDQGFTDEARDLGFRRLVVDAYDHACAVCGARVRAPSGASSIEAAHIVPFAVCHNNDPRNGLGLCRHHHWAFDRGLFAIQADDRITVHPLVTDDRCDESFRGLHGRTIRRPNAADMHPAAKALAWHRKEVFGKVG